MAVLLNRLVALVKTKVSKLLDRAADPLMMLDYSYEKQREIL